MHIKSLRIDNFRNLKQVDITPHPRLNVVWGENGAGKTSLLEALVVLSRGKSFKTNKADELSGQESGAFRIVLEAEYADQSRMMGLERSGAQWKARKDGRDVLLLSDLTRHLPLVLMEPNSHLLISGSPDVRRRFLDWGVFHVEPSFLECWRRYARTLKQRNAALRKRQVRVLDSLDELLAQFGEQLNDHREHYFELLTNRFYQEAMDATAELRDVSLSYHRGWKGKSLADALGAARQRDLERGATSQGPHRADIVLTRDQQLIRSLLSRGEQKSFAATLLLTQAHLLACGGEPPLVLLDDLASEFDQPHVVSVLTQALSCAGQVWVTGTAALPFSLDHKVFHVEHGVVQEMI